MPTQTVCLRCSTAQPPQVLDRLGGICVPCLAALLLEQEDPETGETAPALPVRPGSRFHDLEVLSILGCGGMGIVYKARQPALGRLVALKFLAPGHRGDPEFAARFAAEAKALAALNHPRIVQVHDYGEADGQCFLVMEYVDGLPLRRLLGAGPLSAARAVEIADQAAEALAYAHSRGVVHLDIKPDNLLITPDGGVKIADFGLARPSGAADAPTPRTDGVLGTPDYLAPEQLGRRAPDPRSDLYALGVVLYEMLAGQVPRGRYPAPSSIAPVGPAMDDFVARVLDPQPARRPRDAAEFRAALLRAAAPSRSRWRFAVPAALVAAAAVGGYYFATRPAASVRPSATPSAPEDLLARPGDWSWIDPAPGCRVQDDQILVGPYSARPEIRVVGPGRCDGESALRFELLYVAGPAQEPWLLVNLGGAPDAPALSLVLFPEGDHTYALARREPQGLVLFAKEPLPADGLRPGRWTAVSLAWIPGGHCIEVCIDGRLPRRIPLPLDLVPEGPWSFGFSGAAESVRVRGVRFEPRKDGPRGS